MFTFDRNNLREICDKYQINHCNCHQKSTIGRILVRWIELHVDLLQKKNLFLNVDCQLWLCDWWKNTKSPATIWSHSYNPQAARISGQSFYLSTSLLRLSAADGLYTLWNSCPSGIRQIWWEQNVRPPPLTRRPNNLTRVALGSGWRNIPDVDGPLRLSELGRSPNRPALLRCCPPPHLYVQWKPRIADTSGREHLSVLSGCPE